MILRVDMDIGYTRHVHGPFDFETPDPLTRAVERALRRHNGSRRAVWVSRGTTLATSSTGEVQTTKHAVCHVHHKGANVVGEVIVSWPTERGNH